MKGFTFVVALLCWLSGHLAQAQDSDQVAVTLRSAVVMVQVGKDCYSGFLISKDPPLVATAGHIAGSNATAENTVVWANETGVSAKVKAVHIHNGYEKVRTKKTPYGPDAAILELDPAGPDLGSHLVVAPRKVDEDWSGIAILSAGYPPYTTNGSEGETPTALFRRGVVQRMLDPDTVHTKVMPPSRRPFFQHDLDSVPGESGGPIVSVASGRVIGIQIGDKKFPNETGDRILLRYSVAIHTDTLWEVAEQAGLTEALQQAGQ